VVRRRREAADVSQEALADRAGLHRTYVSLLERGLRNPSLVVIEKLATALDTSMTSLVGEVESRTR
jgi:transcriptional regulator with XRE-family HTH domain